MNMPLLDHTSSLFPDINLGGIRLIGAQHLLGTTRAMLEHLFKHHKLNPTETHILGKCYSTHQETREELERQGVNIHPWSSHFDRRYSFDTYHGAACGELLEKNQNTNSPVILIDDGGSLISEAVNRNFDTNGNVHTAIEQTSAGYNHNKKLFHPFPYYEREPSFRLINIARSKAKIVLETPFIIESILVEFRKKLAIHDFTPRKILIVGSGVIGKALAEKLRTEGFTVETYDQKEGEEGREKLESLVKECNVIFGATGEDILGGIKKHLQSNTMLISVSSSDREFGGRILKEEYFGGIDNCHEDLVLENNIILLNCGFPINFTGEEHSVSPEKIQLTRALIMAAILSGARSGKKNIGNYPLEDRVHDSIVSKFREMQANV